MKYSIETQQHDFLRSIEAESWLHLFENIPDVCFFFKDRQGRYMGANRTYSKFMGLSDTSELIGKSDRDFHPEDLSRNYLDVDEEVMQTGEPVIDMVELWSNKDGRYGWTVTSKYPVYDHDRNAIGVVGFTQPREEALAADTGDPSRADPGESSIAGLQADFLRRMKNPRGTRALFEHLPGVLFYIKNADRRFVSANRLLLDRLGLATEKEIVGTCDLDYFPSEVCAGYEVDDRQILDSGIPTVGRLEQSYNERRLLDWSLTTKLPVYDKAGAIIGLMGVTRTSRDHEADPPLPVSSISKATDLVRQNPDRRVSTEEMAAAAGMSVWQLRRKFRNALGMSPSDFEKASRIQGACHALTETDDSIAEIALSHGFCDQSAFSVQFKKQMGCTPKDYRTERKLGEGIVG